MYQRFSHINHEMCVQTKSNEYKIRRKIKHYVPRIHQIFHQSKFNHRSINAQVAFFNAFQRIDFMETYYLKCVQIIFSEKLVSNQKVENEILKKNFQVNAFIQLNELKMRQQTNTICKMNVSQPSLIVFFKIYYKQVFSKRKENKQQIVENIL